MIDKKEYVLSCIKEYMAQHNISDLTPDNVVELCCDMLDLCISHDHVFSGIGAFLSWKYGCLLQEFYEKSKKYTGQKVLDIPEMKSLSNRITNFESFCETELSYKYEKGWYYEQ